MFVAVVVFIRDDHQVVVFIHIKLNILLIISHKGYWGQNKVD